MDWAAEVYNARGRCPFNGGHGMKWGAGGVGVAVCSRAPYIAFGQVDRQADGFQSRYEVEQGPMECRDVGDERAVIQVEGFPEEFSRGGFQYRLQAQCK